MIWYQDKTNTVYQPYNDETSKGEFINMKLQGMGKVQYPNGDSYFGQFWSGLRSGKGKMVYAKLITIEMPKTPEQTLDSVETEPQADSGNYEG